MTSTTRRRHRRDGELTRQRVLDAAIESILDVGYYQSSTNEIARRAGVTWGVIQHQFRTREGLLLQVQERQWERLQDQLSSAEIVGDTLEERLRCVLEALAGHYGRPEHLALVQIGLDLGRNPKTSAETRDAVQRHGERMATAWRELCGRALGSAADDPTLVGYTFASLRGYLVGDQLASSFREPCDDREVRRLVIDGVAAAVRAQMRAKGLTEP